MKIEAAFSNLLFLKEAAAEQPIIEQKTFENLLLQFSEAGTNEETESNYPEELDLEKEECSASEEELEKEMVLEKEEKEWAAYTVQSLFRFLLQENELKKEAELLQPKTDFPTEKKATSILMPDRELEAVPQDRETIVFSKEKEADQAALNPEKPFLPSPENFPEYERTETLPMEENAILSRMEFSFPDAAAFPESGEIDLEKTEIPEVKEKPIVLRERAVPDSLKREKTEQTKIDTLKMDFAEKLIQPGPTSANEKVWVPTHTITYTQPEQLAQEVGDVIQLSLGNAEKGENQVIRIQLNPENLGKMEIRLEWQDDQVEAQIVVQKKEIKDFLDQQFQQENCPAQNSLSLQQIAVQWIPEQGAAFQAQSGFSQKQSAFSLSKAGRSQRQSDEKEDSEEKTAEKPTLSERGWSLYI